MMWSCSSLPDPLEQGILVQAECDLRDLHSGLATESEEEEHVVRTAIADFFA